MASLISRPRSDGSVAFKVQWRLGGSRDDRWQSETFDDRREALRFQALVEAHHHLWPTGWVKGWGFQAPPALPSESSGTLLEAFGEAYVRRLTSAGPDTQTRYLSQISRLCGWITDATGRVPTLESFTGDDDRDWINARRRAGASAKTIANYHGLLAAIFKDAVSKDLIGKNPCVGVRLPARESESDIDGEKAFLTEAEFGILRAAMHPDSPTCSPWQSDPAFAGVSSRPCGWRTSRCAHLRLTSSCGGPGSATAPESSPSQTQAASTLAARRRASHVGAFRSRRPWRPFWSD